LPDQPGGFVVSFQLGAYGLTQILDHRRRARVRLSLAPVREDHVVSDAAGH